MGMFFHDRGEAPPERAADPEVRRANLRRIGGLFKPYWRRLSGLLGLIVLSAGLGVVPAFLLRRVLVAIQAHDTRAVSLNAAGMIVIAIVAGILGVIQTLLSNQVGQRVMHDLRAAVFRHLQRLSLAFFTRTRTGEVQSRINNDIGGVQNVVTNTATSITSSVTTVVATMIGMLLLSWQLALFAFALIPLFAVLTRRVGNERRRIAKSTQESLADISSIVQESLSVSGILLGKTMGRGDELADRFEGESLRLADLEVRQRMAGRWVMASIQTSFAVMPAAVYWLGGTVLSHSISIATIVAFTTLQARLFFPVGSLLGVGLDIQTSLALFDRIFEYLDAPVDIAEREDPIQVADAGDVVFDSVWFRYSDDAWTLQDVSFTVPAGTTTALVGETGAGKTTLGYLAARLYDVDRGSVSIGGVDVRDLSLRRACQSRRGRLAGDISLPCLGAREPPLREACRERRGALRSGRSCADPPRHRRAPGRLRHRRRRARLPLLGRREAADRDRAHDPPQPADPRPRRGDLVARHRDRAPRPGCARPTLRGADDDRHRAPSLDCQGCGADRRPRPRPSRRTRPARGAARRRRTLHRARQPRRGSSSPRRSSRSRSCLGPMRRYRCAWKVSQPLALPLE